MATLLSAFLFATITAGEVVHIPFNHSFAKQVVVLSGVEQEMVVTTESNDGSCHSEVLIFDDKTTRNGGEPSNVLKSEFGWAHVVVETETGALAVSRTACRWVSNLSVVEIYDAPTLTSGSDPSVVLRGLGTIEVMAQLPSGGLVAHSSIFGSQALVNGGHATTVLSTSNVHFTQVVPFQGGIVYTSYEEDAVLVFDDAAVISGNHSDPALLIGGLGSRGSEWLPTAKWSIPASLCPSGSLVFEDGALAVLGACRNEAFSTLTLLEDINLQARSLRNSSFLMTQGAKQLLALPSGYIAVGVTTEYVNGHVEIFEEDALRSGGEPSLVLRTSGAVTSMAAFQDGRLAVATSIDSWNSGAIDIFDINTAISENAFRVV